MICAQLNFKNPLAWRISFMGSKEEEISLQKKNIWNPQLAYE